MSSDVGRVLGYLGSGTLNYRSFASEGSASPAASPAAATDAADDGSAFPLLAAALPGSLMPPGPEPEVAPPSVAAVAEPAFAVPPETAAPPSRPIPAFGAVAAPVSVPAPAGVPLARIFRVLSGEAAPQPGAATATGLHALFRRL